MALIFLWDARTTFACWDRWLYGLSIKRCLLKNIVVAIEITSRSGLETFLFNSLLIVSFKLNMFLDFEKFHTKLKKKNLV